MPKGFLGRVSVSGMSTLLWWSRSTSTWAEVVSGHDKMDPGKLPAKVHITFFGLSTHQCTKNSTMGLLAIGRYSVWLMPQTPKQLQFRVLEISSEARNPRPLCSWSCCGRLVLQFHLVRSWNSTHFPIARWFLHIAWAKGLWFFCFFRDRCFSGVFYQAADDWPHSWWKWKGRPNHSPSRKDALDSLLFFFAQGGGEEIQASSPFSVKKD